MSQDIQNKFIETLNAKMESMYSSQLDGKFHTINVPNGFYWGIQFGANNFYNKKSLDQVSAQAILGRNNILTIGGSNFMNLYKHILENTVYNFSQADRRVMQTEQANASAQIQDVINAWESSMGLITEEQKQEAIPPSKLGYIQYMVQDKWGNDIDKIPSSLNDFKMAYQAYEVMCQVSFQLQSASAKSMLRLKSCRNNSKNPTAANGGLEIGSNSYYTAFGPFPMQNKINADLQNLGNKANITMSFSDFSSSETHFSIDGKVGGTIPILDILKIKVDASAEYTVDTYTTSSSSLEIEMSYEGVTFISAPLTDGNLSVDNKKGWYDNDILSQAVSNAGLAPDKQTTGYVLLGNQYPVDEYFGEGKKFSRIKTWVISQQPTIKMKFCSSNSSKIVSDFKQDASVSVTLLGLFEIGSVKESYSIKKVNEDKTSGCVTVEMTPSNPVGSTVSENSTAYVMGGVTSYPPTLTMNDEEVEGDLKAGDRYYWVYIPHDASSYRYIGAFKSRAAANTWWIAKKSSYRGYTFAQGNSKTRFR